MRKTPEEEVASRKQVGWPKWHAHSLGQADGAVCGLIAHGPCPDGAAVVHEQQREVRLKQGCGGLATPDR